NAGHNCSQKEKDDSNRRQLQHVCHVAPLGSGQDGGSFVRHPRAVKPECRRQVKKSFFFKQLSCGTILWIEPGQAVGVNATRSRHPRVTKQELLPCSRRTVHSSAG